MPQKRTNPIAPPGIKRQERIHQHGRSYLPAYLVKRATGSGIQAEPYLQYLEQKYGAIFG